ncbi:vq motif-containing protein 29 [Quercus suber]|uniref:Vq motif-containing protein 29 n=1 Tax=Quercus suber TaxID=58331 RepID=A0AAW0LN69_QUESU
MEAYSSSSSSSTYLSQSFQETKSAKLPQPFNSSLHTVKKPPTKPWKKPVAPLPPTPPRIYKVDPINFRDLVQKLTGATEFQSQQRLQSVAPPPLNVANSTQPLMYNRNISVPPQLHHSTTKPPLSAVVYQDLTSREMKPQKISDSEEAAFSLGMNLSPSSLNWCSYPLMSPGTLSTYSSSSSSSTYLSQSFQETKSAKLPQPFNSSLHTVKKPPTKPWKKPVAPLPPTPPRIYKVDPINFRDLVQKLTGATEFQSQQRLQSVAPPPLNVANSTQPLMYNRNISVPPQLHHSTTKPPLSAVVYQDLTSREMKPQKISDSEEAAFSLGMNLSPSSLNWCSYPLMSPGTLSSLEQSTNIGRVNEYGKEFVTRTVVFVGVLPKIQTMNLSSDSIEDNARLDLVCVFFSAKDTNFLIFGQ